MIEGNAGDSKSQCFSQAALAAEAERALAPKTARTPRATTTPAIPTVLNVLFLSRVTCRGPAVRSRRSTGRVAKCTGVRPKDFLARPGHRQSPAGGGRSSGLRGERAAQPQTLSGSGVNNPLAPAAAPGEIQILRETTSAARRAKGGRETEAFRAPSPSRVLPCCGAPCRAACISRCGSL